MAFNTTLYELRKEQELSQRAFAAEIGYCYSIVSDWETGKKTPSLEAAIAIADFFRVSLDYLVGRENYEGIKKY
jgi:transcriptional regulator with XRE-family HTH domain